MPATFNGAVTIGGCVPGLADAFDDVGTALEVLRDAVLLHLPCFLEAIAAMADVRIAAVVDFEAQLNASIAVGLQLTASLTDPTAYLLGLLSGLAQLNISIPSLLPQVALSTQIAANAAVGAAFAAKIALVDAKIEVVVNLLNACYLALLAVSAAAFSAIEKFHTFTAYLETAGAYAISVTSTLGGLGAAIDAVTASTGMPAATQVVTTVQIVKASDGPAVAAQRACFLVA